MIKKRFELLRLLWRENWSRPRLQRQPEPSLEMDDPDNVMAFHEQGSASGPLLPIYHFNALATSRLLPHGGTLLDLGSGSGQYLAYLGQRRPDIRIIGIELAPEMIRLGDASLDRLNLRSRIELRLGDMTRFREIVSEPINAISSVFALHHLSDFSELDRCLAEIAVTCREQQCAIWLFDHARPRHPGTPEVFPEIFTPEAPRLFRQDSRNSLIASWSFEELVSSLECAELSTVEHARSRFLPLYQAHWMFASEGRDGSIKTHAQWHADRLPAWAQKDFQGLKFLFPGVSPVAK